MTLYPVAPVARQSVPFIHQQWSTSSDSLVPPYSMAHGWQAQHAARHSVANSEFPGFQMPRPPVSLTRPSSPEVQASHQFAHISPHQMASYTLPSSPISQSSAVPSLATTSNDALVCASDGEAYTPQDPATQFYATDNMFPTFTSSGHGAAQAPVAVPSTEYGADISPAKTAQAYQNLRDVHHRPPFAPSYGLPTQNGSLSGLKRDFERAKLGSASPNDARASKRFAAEVFGQDERRRHHRFSSGFCSPSEHAALRHTAEISSSPCTSAREHVSISPSYSLPFANFPSPSQVAPYPRPQSIGMDDMSHSVIPTANGAAQRIHPFVPQAGCQSVFSSALTPNSLAAPLDMASGMWPVERSKMPLKYYSLAAGEARGNLGTYMPPSYGFVSHHHELGWQHSMTPSFDESHLAMHGPWPHVDDVQVKRGSMTPLSMDGYALNGRLSHGKLAPPHQQDAISQPYHQGVQSAGSGVGLQFYDDGHHYYRPAQRAPPFALDPQGWPLTNTSAPSFMFPYHLVSMQPTQRQASFTPTA